ncbi:TonB-dependent receptor [Mesorhizobium sp. NBSH29]|uniref:TonB-dependent receptor domain-containing protein n=1 Tax=Mesorhizobium sp. NBSH29 TaxID=2654249 RepID=UPI00189650AE|nr:TonB-dependent receptor [Mesorhizobium sp. NBSH29]QPC85843.1 TonB-dependent receptor [Mesorhizobium sp. NBSH29]
MGLVSRNTAILLSGAALLAMGLGASHAQEVEKTARQGRVTLLQRIVVGAGTDKVAIDTPQAVTVVEQEDIDRAQATTVGDIFAQIPGVTVSGSERVLGETFNIRGIGSPESGSEEGRIIVTVDGATKYYEQYRMGGFFSDPELYKRVEVLRGPASSTLYGSGALGGVINFTTKDASDFIADGQTGALRLKGAFNSNRNGWLGAAILAHRFNENFEVLAAGNYRVADNYVTGNGTEIRSSYFEAPSGLIKGTLGDGNEQTIRLSYQHWTSSASDQDYAQVSSDKPGSVFGAFGTVDRLVTDKTAVLSYENPASDNPWLNLKVTGSYSDTSVDQSNHKPFPGDPDFPSTIFQDTRYGYETWQFNVQNTFDYTGESFENHLTIGSQTARQHRTTDTELPIGTHPEGTDFQTGIFLQNEFVWNERLTIIPGIRFDFQRLEADGSVRDAPTVEDTAISPKIAALYRLNDTLSVFGSYAHTERFPTLDEIYSSDFTRGGIPNYSINLNKERSNNYEAGFAVSAYDILQGGDALQFKATGFYNDITDLIERRRNGYPQYVNVGKAHLYGAEIEIGYDSDYVFANAGYALTRGRNDVTGGGLNTIAPDELSLTIGGRMPDQDLSFGWKARFVDNQDRVAGTPNTRVATPGFSVHDVFLNWKPEEGKFANIEASFGIDNIFNKQYREFLSNDPAKGRTFKVALIKQFGW